MEHVPEGTESALTLLRRRDTAEHRSAAGRGGRVTPAQSARLIFDDVPYGFLCHTFTQRPPHLHHTTENLASADTRRSEGLGCPEWFQFRRDPPSVPAVRCSMVFD